MRNDKENYADIKRQREEKEQRDLFYNDIRKIRKIAQYFFWLSIISITSWIILLLLGN